eukprot:gene20738-biopygen8592
MNRRYAFTHEGWGTNPSKHCTIWYAEPLPTHLTPPAWEKQDMHTRANDNRRCSDWGGAGVGGPGDGAGVEEDDVASGGM